MGLMRWERVAAILALVTGGIGSITGYYLGIRPLFYPSLSIGFAAVSILTNNIVPSSWMIGHNWSSRRIYRILDIFGFLLIAISVILFVHSESGVSNLVYWAAALCSAVIVTRAMLAPSKITLLQSILLALVLRFAIWFSAPVIAKDARLHKALIGYITNNGELVASAITYYRYYPISHILGSEIAIVSSADAKIASFVGLAGAAIVGISIIYMLVLHLLGKSPSTHQAAIFTVIFLSTAPSTVKRGGILIAQTLELGLVPLILYAAYRSADRRFRLIAVLGLFSLVITHNLAPALLTGFLLTLTLVNKIIRRLWFTPTPQEKYSIVFVAAALLATVHYYITIGYLNLQIGRLLIIFFGDRSITGDISSSNIGTRAPFTLQDPVLHSGIDLYILAAAFIVVGVVAIREISAGTKTDINYSWYLAAASIFSISGVAIAAGGSELTFRALAFLLIVTAPIFATACKELNSGVVGRGALIILLMTAPMLTVVATETGTRNGAVSPTNRVNDIPVDIQRDELAASEFASYYSKQTYVDGYTYRSLRFRQVEMANRTMTDEPSLSHFTSAGSIHNLTTDTLFSCNATTLYRTRYSDYPGIFAPRKYNKFYDSGGGYLYDC